jgi:hypothetical protein
LPPPANLLGFTLDTVRADRLGADAYSVQWASGSPGLSPRFHVPSLQRLLILHRVFEKQLSEEPSNLPGARNFRGRPGLRLDLDLRFGGGRSHLPVVALTRAA